MTITRADLKNKVKNIISRGLKDEPRKYIEMRESILRVKQTNNKKTMVM